MNLKNAWKMSRIVLLVGIIAGIALASVGCIGGVASVGWSGGTVENNKLFVGSREGRLVSIDLETQGIQKAEALQSTTSTGLFGCNPMFGGGCGGGASAVAIYGSPAVADGLVYIAGYNGKVYAYEQDNVSTRRWVYPVDTHLEPIVSGLVVSDGRIFFGDSDGIFHALDANTGDELWTFETGDRIWGTATVDGTAVYFGSFDKNFYALNVSDGSEIWHFEADGAIYSKPLAQDGVVYFGTFNKTLYALNESDGNQKWTFTGGNWFWAHPVIVGDTVYAGCLDDKVYVLNGSGGSLITEIDLGAGISSDPVVVENRVVFANRDGVVYAVDTSNNQSQILEDLETNVNGPLSAYEEIVYIQVEDYQVARINAVTGAVLQPLFLSN